MTHKRWDVLIAAVLCAGLGIASGYYAAGPSDGAAVDGAPPPAADDADHGHDHLADETLQNLGVEIGTLELTTAARTASVVAQVVESPRTHQPLQAPIGGVIQSLEVEPGQLVDAGTAVATLVRDPIPLPALELTAELVSPSHDEIHASIRELREANAEIEITEAELARIEQFTGGEEGAAVLPLQTRIDLEYALRRARVRAEVAHHELERHGFSHEQMEAVTEGQHVQLFDAPHVRRALVHSGLWAGLADRLLDALPAAVREVPVAVGAVAELAVKGLASGALCAWLEANPDAGERFLEVAALLLGGSGLPDVQRLHELGALAPRFALRAPAYADDWDVAAVHARPGDHVAAGTPIAVLHDARALRLRLDPVGSEVGALARAIAAGRPCRALPLVPGAGPALDEVHLDYVAAGDRDDRDDRIHGWARVPNFVGATRTSDGGPTYRSWAIHAGLRYRVLVPTDVAEGVFVLPRSAVTEDGPDRIVFVPHGDGGFDEVPVAVLFEDEDRIVLEASAHPRLRAGQEIVVRGAFELGLAMHAGDVGADHGHAH